MKIAVDFDGTCVEHCYPDVGQDVPNCVKVLKALQGRGYLIILNTMRSGQSLQDAVKWFRERDIFLSGINQDPGQTEWTSSPKVYAEKYIDDAALGAKLIRPKGFDHKVIDWEWVAEKMLPENYDENNLPSRKLLEKYVDTNHDDPLLGLNA